MRISKRRKSRVEPRPTGSKIRPTQRRSIKAATRRVRVNAAELARRKFLHLAAGAATLPAMSRSADAKASTTPTTHSVKPPPHRTHGHPRCPIDLGAPSARWTPRVGGVVTYWHGHMTNLSQPKLALRVRLTIDIGGYIEMQARTITWIKMYDYRSAGCVFCGL